MEAVQEEDSGRGPADMEAVQLSPGLRELRLHHERAVSLSREEEGFRVDSGRVAGSAACPLTWRDGSFGEGCLAIVTGFQQPLGPARPGEIGIAIEPAIAVPNPHHRQAGPAVRGIGEIPAFIGRAAITGPNFGENVGCKRSGGTRLEPVAKALFETG